MVEDNGEKAVGLLCLAQVRALKALTVYWGPSCHSHVALSLKALAVPPGEAGKHQPHLTAPGTEA